MDLKNIIQALLLSIFYILPDMIDVAVQVYNGIYTVNEMDIDVFVEPAFPPQTTTPCPEPTTTTTETGHYTL